MDSQSLLSIGIKYGLCIGGYMLLHFAINRRLRSRFTNNDKTGGKRSTTEWYVIHAIGNGLITVLTVKDLIQTTIDPIHSFGNIDDLSSLTNYRSYPVILMSSMHLYHIIMYFRQMQPIDWIHHLVSGGVVGSLCIFYITGSVVNHGLFFMCGLPGGIDYFLLVLSDLGLIDRITEKRINRYLNMYIRLPGVLFNCYAGLVYYLYTDPYPYSLALGSMIFMLDAWNAIYFAQRVVENYGAANLSKRERSIKSSNHPHLQ